jgi:hypothetical protein
MMTRVRRTRARIEVEKGACSAQEGETNVCVFRVATTGYLYALNPGTEKLLHNT